MSATIDTPLSTATLTPEDTRLVESLEESFSHGCWCEAEHISSWSLGPDRPLGECSHAVQWVYVTCSQRMLVCAKFRVQVEGLGTPWCSDCHEMCNAWLPA